MELAHHFEEFIALGVPDCRLAALPAIYANLLADEASLLIDQPKGLTSAEVTALQALTPRFKQICEKLAAFGIPASLNQGDFHDGNTLLRDGRITFFDWATPALRTLSSRCAPVLSASRSRSNLI